MSQYPSFANVALRTCLAATGIVTVYVGVDNAFGGVATLGLQGPTDFFSITQDQAFRVRDSHVRFLGAVWGGVGLVFLTGAIWPIAMRTTLVVLAGLAVLGGLARFSSMGLSALFGAGLGLPLVIELVLFPLLGTLVWRAGSQRGGLPHNGSSQIPGT
jgi:Domain of unknown function (DUF4345)